MSALAAALLLAAVPQEAAAPDTAAEEARTRVAEHYRRLDTREATLERMLRVLAPEDAEWGEGYVAAPFPFDEETGLDAVHGPEEALGRMAPGGPGPDLEAAYGGKGGPEVRWRPLGDATNRLVTLDGFEEPDRNVWATAYVYTTLVADEAKRIEVPFGSDDGVRVWLNGEVVFEADRMRGFTAGEDTLVLDVAEGENHLLLEVFQGVGGWEFQIDTRPDLSAADDAELFYRLDRDFPPTDERRHYRVMSYPVPDDVVLEVGGLDFLGDGRPVVCTRRGEVYVLEDAYDEPPVDARFRLFASGLHEPLGLAVRRDVDGEAVYAVQRAELTRLRDTDGDGAADAYETYGDGWGVSGNYHEFAFGPEFDDEGNAWVTLNVGFCGSLGKALVPWRGWALKITPAGEVVPVCDGLRSPNGLARNAAGDFFYVDNQGDYVATNRLSHLVPGSWHGHPASLRWREGLSPDQRPPRQPPAVWFPYEKMGQSAADIALDDTGGAFGPFAGQLFVGDQTRALVMRVFLEKVGGHWQGACFPFLRGLACGVNRVAFAPDGSLLVGETDRGWGSIGRRRHGLERVVFTGEMPFEIRAMRAVKGGFRLDFTRPPDLTTAASVASYSLTSYTYDYHADYGAPERDAREVSVDSVRVDVEGGSVTLFCSPLRAGYVHELRAEGVRDEAGEPLLHPEAYYTLVRLRGAPRAVPTEDRPSVLFLTHSAGFEHEVVRRARADVYSHAEERFVEAVKDRFRVTATQDCGVLTADRLRGYDAVVLYTTGELPAPEGGGAALLDWVRAGGALAGVHSAADTFYELPGYHDMLGGTFDGHPWNEPATVSVADPDHPATAGWGESLSIADELYQFRDFAAETTHVLARLASTESDPDLARGAHPETGYPLAWCREYGRGRVFYTALGHRPEVWRDERFLGHLAGGVSWALAGEPVPAAPPAAPPDGARVLFDGEDLSRWRHEDGFGVRWVVRDGTFEVVPGAGDLVTRGEWGDLRLHLEFRFETSGGQEAPGEGDEGSGLLLHGVYPIEIRDRSTGEAGAAACAAIEGWRGPDVDASRAPSEWQSFDAVFRAPRFHAEGAEVEDARLTLWHNGVLVHDDVALPGVARERYGDGERPRGPLVLRDEGSRVAFRNVWVRPL